MTQYPLDPGLQSAFMSDLFDRVNALRNQITGITLSQDEEPTHAEWEAQWILEGYDLPIAPGSDLYWYDSDHHLLRGVYRTMLKDMPTDISEPNGYISSGVTLERNYVASADVFQDGRTYFVIGTWFDMDTDAAYTVDRDGTWTVIPNTAGATKGSLNDDDSQLCFVNAAKTDILTINIDGTGSATIVSGRTSIAWAYWESSYVLFYDSTGFNIVADTGGAITNLAGAVAYSRSWKPVLNPTDGKIYYNKDDLNIYKMDVTGLNDTFVFTEPNAGCWLFDLAVTQQKLYYHYAYPRENWSGAFGGGGLILSGIARVDVAGTNEEDMDDPFVERSWLTYRNSYASYQALGYAPYGNMGSYPSTSGYLGIHYQDYFDGTRLFTGDPATADDPERFINWCGQSSIRRSSLPSNFLIAPNLFENESTGKIHRVTNYTPAVHDIELLWSLDFTGSQATDITIPNISQDYKHLLLFWTLESYENAVRDELVWQINGDTTIANYSTFTQRLSNAWNRTEDIAAGVYAGIVQNIKGRSWAADRPSHGWVLIPNYTDTFHKKQFLIQSTLPQTTLAEWHFGFGLWESTAAITDLYAYLYTGPTFSDAAKSSFVELYGLSGDVEFDGI